MATVEELVAVKSRVEAEYLGRPGVTGVDVGFKQVGGELTDQIAIRVSVEEKRDDVPADQRVPAEIDGNPTDVLERRYELQVASESVDVSAQADTTHYPSLQGGVSMGPSRVVGGSIFAGTLGAIVIDGVTNQRAALTNFHVACVDSTWSVGDRQVQPSRIDTGVVPGDEFGAIARAVLSDHVDGALISIDAGKTTVATITEIGNVRGVKPATLGTAVRKRGRTTGLTYGTIDGISSTVNVDYGPGIGVKTLHDQVSVAADTTHNAMFSDHGDSGSVIVDGNGYIVALLFAGAGAGTVGNPIASVLSELNVTVAVTKAIIKDIKDGAKDFIKDKDHKERAKDIIKDKEVKERVKDVIKDKEIVLDNKRLKDVRDVKIIEGPPVIDPGPLGPGPGPAQQSGQAALEQRLGALEAQLGQLTSFIGADLRPDLSASAFSGEQQLAADDLEQLRAELQQHVDSAVAAKSELDGPQA